MGVTKDSILATDFSRELKLLISIITDGCDKDKELLRNIQWGEFLDLTEHHRLFPIVYKKLKNQSLYPVPSQVLLTLEAWYKRNTFHMLHLCAEMEMVSRWFLEKEVECLFLKGPLLANEIYGNTSMRTSKDLDILIKLSDLEKVNQILLENGYTSDKYIRTVLDDWKWKNHHIEYTNADTGSCLEIHWRLNPGPGKEPSFKELWNRRRESPINQYPVYLLSLEDLLVYLVTHGARHGWFRLRWLVDISELRKKDVSYEKVDALIIKYDYDHLAGQAFLLSSALLKVEIPFEMKRFTFMKKSQKLALHSGEFIKSKENLHNEDLPKDIQTSYHSYLYSIKTLQQKYLSLLNAIFPVPEDMQILPLPKRLYFLYLPLRPFIWIWKKTKRHILFLKRN